jgi:DNA-binding GntR family transcriptional regulator
MLMTDAPNENSRKGPPRVSSGGLLPGLRQSDAAFEAIRRAVVRCELTPGAIVSEAEIETRFSLKRAATRSALERLSAQGLVRPLHRRGYEVRPITLRDLTELYQFREVIEMATVRLAAGQVDEAGLRYLDKVCAESYEPGDRDSEDRFLRANTEFHLQIAAAAGNDRLTHVLSDVLGEMERLFHFGLAIRDRNAEMRLEHEVLIEALARGDAAAAECAARDELSSSKAMVLNALISSASLMDVSITAAGLA